MREESGRKSENGRACLYGERDLWWEGSLKGEGFAVFLKVGQIPGLPDLLERGLFAAWFRSGLCSLHCPTGVQLSPQGSELKLGLGCNRGLTQMS